MNCVEFLQAVWPVSGLYCVALGKLETSRDGKPFMKFRHYGFDTIPEAAAFATRESVNAQQQVFFAIHALKGRVLHKFEGREVMRVLRTASNMRATMVFYTDIDCGRDSKGGWKPYKTKADGLAALMKFLDDTGLPMPMIIDSGYGLHCYWIMAEEIPSETWVKYAEILKRLQEHHGFKVDYAITSDSARILRPIGTFNQKNPDNPRKVKRIQSQDTPYQTSEFLALLEKAAEALPAPEVTQAAHLPPQEQPAPTTVAKVCPSFVKMVSDAKVASGRVWMLTNTICLHTKGGTKLAHRLASQHPEYQFDETQAKLDRLIDQKMGPPTCGTIAKEPGLSAICQSCPHLATPTSSPIVYARRLPTDLPTEIPPPQLPYMRTKRGVEWLPPAPDTGPQPPARVICHYDLYPTMAVDEARTETKAIQWTAVLPHHGTLAFRLPADIYHDEGKLISALANKGITVDKGPASKQLGGYMSHYIRLLQQHQKEQRQHEHFGWPTGSSYKQFIHGQSSISAGDTKPALLSPALANAAAAMTSKGTLEAQVKAMGFFDFPEYYAQQLMAGLSLAAPLLFLTNHFGFIVNFFGPSGASKTTALHTMASFWGRGEKFAIGGTDDDATANGRAGRIRMLANLPAFVDEITMMSPDQIKNMALSITQATTDKIRHKRTGTEQLLPDTEKSTVMICTSNTSVHALLSASNQAGNAGSMRALEVKVKRERRHTKIEADAFIRTIRENHGHIGPVFIQWCIRNMETVTETLRAIEAELERRGLTEQEERFWIAGVAIAVLGLRLGRQLGLLPYDPEVVLDWAITELLPANRRVVSESYLEPIDVLAAYMDHVSQNILVVVPPTNTMGSGGKIWTASRELRGALKGRLELGRDTLFLAPQPFKEFCEHRRIYFNGVVDHLVHSKVITREKMKLTRYLVDYESPLVWNLKVDLRHELMAGLPPIEVDNKVVQMFPAKKDVASS